MVSLDQETCTQLYLAETNLYRRMVSVSLGLTIVIFCSRLCYKPWLTANPTTAAKLHLGAAAVKLLLGILLFTVWSPVCPAECNNHCGTATVNRTYPIIVVVVAVLWFRRGIEYQTLAAQTPTTTTEFGGAGATEFSTVGSADTDENDGDHINNSTTSLDKELV